MALQVHLHMGYEICEIAPVIIFKLAAICIMSLRKRSAPRDSVVAVRNEQKRGKDESDEINSGIKKAIDIMYNIWEKRQKYEQLAPQIQTGGTGYLAHHYFPDIMPPARYPDYLAFPTHIHSEVTSLTVSPITRDGVTAIVFYWAPGVSVMTSIKSHADYESTAAIGANASSFPWFAISKRPYIKTPAVASTITTGATVAGAVFETNSNPAGGVSFFHPPVEGGNAQWDIVRTGMQNGDKVLRSRILSGSLTIVPTGKPLEQQGTLRVGSGLVGGKVQVSSNSTTLSSFSANLVNTPIFGGFRADEEIVIQYRHLDEILYSMGPYHDAAETPYYIGIIEGLDASQTFEFKLERTFESIVASNMTELVNPLKEVTNGNGQSFIKDNYHRFETHPIMSRQHYEEKKRKIFGGSISQSNNHTRGGYPLALTYPGGGGGGADPNPGGF